ncbi:MULTISPECIES: class I SAM-dependent methyltransferase [Acidiphilium]|jgi:predicted nicotinamide N-methyase|uniref:Methyltransferase-like protein n=1 Tax=Acidiphilium cryptum (strain JF-5) TaxID=349163 RepID=A5FZP8_ACICJ|nr:MULTISPECIES: 50S ribosomal protein L11 methyltransferase [Acidiphilium]ABQ31080.1 methyltransferase-like protein [Acidiphilium cryptum JF-5]MBS3023202.1 methyltransferase [Acidiphilium multivorum]UNC13464.1 methyltransferase [Acidiphilium multivorum]
MRDAAAFIRASTAWTAPALVPEIGLHLATEITPIWQATEEFLAESGIAPPYWAFAWPGSIALARHVLDHPESVRGRRVMDFAAGSGLAAIAAAKAGAARVTAVEIDPVAGAAIGLNAAANGVAVEIVIGDATGTAPAQDLILCGDVCYEKPMTAHIWPWLQRCAATAEVWIADPGRAYVPRAGLAEFARRTVPTLHELESRSARETVLYRIAGA